MWSTCLYKSYLLSLIFYLLSLQIRIIRQLIGHGGLWTMACQYGGVLWDKGGYATQALLHFCPTALVEVSSADTHTKQRVASKHRFLLFAIKEHRAVAMTWRADNLQLMMAKADDVAIFQQTTRRRLLLRNQHAKHLLSLLWQTLHQFLVFGSNLHLQHIALIDVGIAKIVVQMSMCSQQMHRLQLVLFDIVAKGLTFFVLVGATVDDDTLVALVAHHIAVLLQWINHQSFDIQHNLSSFNNLNTSNYFFIFTFAALLSLCMRSKAVTRNVQRPWRSAGIS